MLSNFSLRDVNATFKSLSPHLVCIEGLSGLLNVLVSVSMDILVSLRPSVLPRQHSASSEDVLGELQNGGYQEMQDWSLIKNTLNAGFQ